MIEIIARGRHGLYYYLMPLITLTTDFGEDGHFAGVLKGVILGIAPRAGIVDITHGVTPFEITEAAFTVAEAARFFPKKTIHVVVVDPGVGTKRRPILAEAEGQYFLAPDNGVLSMIFARAKCKVRHLTNAKYRLKEVSHTFHGRDIFAPSAAHLARGVKTAQFGPLIQDHLRSEVATPTRIGTRCWAGVILKADRFGNLITNYHVREFPLVETRPIVLMAGVHSIEKFVRTYGDAPRGEPVAMVGSSGYVEIALNQGNAAKSLGLGTGASLELSIY